MTKATAPASLALSEQECSDLHDFATVPAYQGADACGVLAPHKGETFLVFRPEDSDYAQWIKNHMGGKPGPKGGIAVRIGYFTHCVERKNLYAEAYAQMLRVAGIQVETFTYSVSDSR